MIYWDKDYNNSIKSPLKRLITVIHIIKLSYRMTIVFV